jgi:hypothetical protein
MLKIYETVFVSNEELTKYSTSDNIILQVSSNVKKIVLPFNVADLLGQHQLSITSDKTNDEHTIRSIQAVKRYYNNQVIKMGLFLSHARLSRLTRQSIFLH